MCENLVCQTSETGVVENEDTSTLVKSLSLWEVIQIPKSNDVNKREPSLYVKNNTSWRTKK